MATRGIGRGVFTGPRAVASGEIKVDPIISAVGELRDGAEWFERLRDDSKGLLKVVLRP